MRKSFILSLVMVVVLIASLATATFAWYTAQTQVNVTEATVATARVTRNLVIDKAFIDSTSNTGKTISMAKTDAIDPMILSQGVTVGTTTIDACKFVSFTLDNNAVKSYNGNVTAPELTQVGGVNGNKIYLANTGSTAGSLTATVTISEDNANNGLRVALFATGNIASSAVDTASGYKLVGIWCKNDDDTVAYESSTAIANEDQLPSAVAKTETYDTDDDQLTYSAQAMNIGTLNAGVDTNIVVRVVIWFEGGKVLNQHQNASATFNIDFDIAAIPEP